jgi:hypothetical protein
MPYRVTEPHPTISGNNNIHSGRGGAGNTFKAPVTTSGPDASGPASRFANGLPSYNANARFVSGRGGAGNVHLNRERAIFSFDEELQRQTTREMMEKEGGASWHVGRGGAGNLMSSRSPSRSARKGSASSTGSAASNESSKSYGFFRRISQTFDRN